MGQSVVRNIIVYVSEEPDVQLHSKSVIFLTNLKQSTVVTINSKTRKWCSLPKL